MNDRHVKNENSGSSHHVFHENEPFYWTGVIKLIKLLNVFQKRQGDEFIRAKNFLILSLRNEKVTFIVFHVKDINISAP